MSYLKVINDWSRLLRRKGALHQLVQEQTGRFSLRSGQLKATLHLVHRLQSNKSQVLYI